MGKPCGIHIGIKNYKIENLPEILKSLVERKIIIAPISSDTIHISIFYENDCDGKSIYWPDIPNFLKSIPINEEGGISPFKTTTLINESLQLDRISILFDKIGNLSLSVFGCMMTIEELETKVIANPKIIREIFNACGRENENILEVEIRGRSGSDKTFDWNGSSIHKTLRFS